MLVVTRHVVPVADGPAFLQAARDALALLGACQGFRDGSVARAADDPERFVLWSRWVDVGSYRRALSSYDVKLHAVPLLSTAIDEPTAYEVLHERGPAGVVDDAGALAGDFDQVGLGAAAGPEIPRLPS